MIRTPVRLSLKEVKDISYTRCDSKINGFNIKNSVCNIKKWFCNTQ